MLKKKDEQTGAQATTQHMGRRIRGLMTLHKVGSFREFSEFVARQFWDNFFIQYFEDNLRMDISKQRHLRVVTGFTKGQVKVLFKKEHLKKKFDDFTFSPSDVSLIYNTKTQKLKVKFLVTSKDKFGNCNTRQLKERVDNQDKR